MIPVAIVTHPDYLNHLTGVGHPESPKRYEVIEASLRQIKLLNAETRITPRLASVEELLLCHTSDYIRLIEQEVMHLGATEKANATTTLSTGDVIISSASWSVARLAAGGVLAGVDAVMGRVARTAFCAVRPPGHHATSSRGMGFCLFNNVAIAARYAQQKYGIERVAIIDWDVHHGNGTQEIFENDQSVFYFSVHQSPLYPFTGNAEEIGIGQASGTICNCPIQAGRKARQDIFEAFEKKLVPAMKRFQPQLVMISAGFDGHELDPLGSWGLTDDDYAGLTKIVIQIAQNYSCDKIVSALEGGYSLKALATVVPGHVQTLHRGNK